MYTRTGDPHIRIGGLERAVRAVMALSLLAAIGAGLLIHSPARAQEKGLLSTSSVTPADVVLYAEVSLDTGSAQLQQFDKLLARLGSTESLIDAINKSATDPSSDIDLTGAEVAVAVLPSALAEGASVGSEIVGGATSGQSTSDLAQQVSSQAGNQGAVVIIKPTDIASVEASMKKTANANTNNKTQTYKGAVITTYGDTEGSSTAYAVVGDYLFAGSTAEDIKAFVDGSQPGADTLANLDAFAKASGLLPADRVAYAFLNGPVTIDAATKAAGDPSLGDAIREVLATVSGYTGMVMTADDAGVRFESVIVPANGAADAKPAGSAVDLDFASRMPAGTVVYASGFDLGRSMVMNALGLGIGFALTGISSGPTPNDQATPAPFSIDGIYESLARMFGFNLKTALLDQMTGPFGFGVWGTDATDISGVNAVLLSGAKDPGVTGDSLGTISLLVQAAGQGSINVTSKQVPGGLVNHVEFQSSGSTVAIDYGVVEDRLVLGLNDGAETALTGPTDSLADSDTFRSAMSYLPAEYQAAYFVDVAQLSATSAGVSTTVSGQDAIADFLGTPVAATSAQSFAAVTHIESGYAHTSAILVVP
jgi:uncharacterized protein DUF3352